MNKFLAYAFTCLGAILCRETATATTIDFASYAVGTRFDAPLAIGDLTFSSTSGTLLIQDFGAGKTICAFDGVGCFGTLLLQSAQGITGLTLNYSGDDAAGSTIAYEGQTGRLSFVGRLESDGDPTTSGLITAGFAGLTLLSLSSNDPSGVGFGNFDFSFDAAVPEPASWMLMISGFALVGTALRRQREFLAV